MSAIDRIRSIVEWFLAAAAALTFGATFGWQYGVNNQVVYLLGALKMVTPGTFTRDWFATQTTHYHPAYELLGALLLLIRRDGALIGYGQTVVIAGGMLCVFWLLRVLAGRLALPSFLLLVAIALCTRTFSVGGGYVFDAILQPSTLASIGLLASVPLFVQGKWQASSVALGVSGLFHANYLVLLFGVFLIAHGLIGLSGIKHRLFGQFLMPAIVLLAFMPMILVTAGAPHAKEAEDIYFNVRAPHHFQIARFQMDLIPFTAWQLIGFGAVWPMARNRNSPLGRVAAIATGLLCVVWLGLALSAGLQVHKATQLFSWRLAPHAELLLQAAACAVAMQVILRPGLARRWNATALASLIAGICLLITHETLAKHETVQWVVSGIFLTALAVTLVGAGLRFLSSQRRASLAGNWARVAPWVFSLAGVILVYEIALPELRHVADASSMIHGINRNERELTDWMRQKTPKDALFLTPPGIETLRYHSQRAIVVDWKSNPIVPGEVFEWQHRLAEVCGRPMRGAGDMRGYEAMDRRRLDHLKDLYKLDYAVLRRGRERDLGYRTVWANAVWVVLDLKQPS